MLEERGGISQVRSAGAFPRDRQQAANFRRDVKRKENKVTSCHDPLLTVMDRRKHEQRDPKSAFIREVSSCPEMQVVLANNMQLDEVKRFCTNPAKFSVCHIQRRRLLCMPDHIPGSDADNEGWRSPCYAGAHSDTPAETILQLLQSAIHHDQVRA